MQLVSSLFSSFTKQLFTAGGGRGGQRAALLQAIKMTKMSEAAHQQALTHPACCARSSNGAGQAAADAINVKRKLLAALQPILLPRVAQLPRVTCRLSPDAGPACLRSDRIRQQKQERQQQIDTASGQNICRLGSRYHRQAHTTE